MSQPTPASFAVVIPMYDEETGAEECVRRVCDALARWPRKSVLVAVEDGSADGTAAVLERLAAVEERMLLVKHPKNLGYGAALRTGARAAAEGGFDYALFMDSDLTNDPDDIERFLPEMDRGVDVIKATRYSHGGGVRGVPAKRVVISRVGNAVARRLFRLPITDVTNGFRAVRVDLLRRLELRENAFSVIMEEIYRAKPLARTWANVPVVLTNRAADLRPTSFSYRPSTFWRYLKYPLKSAWRDLTGSSA